MERHTRLGDMLVALKLLTPEQLERGLEIQRYWQQPLGQILVQQGFITRERLQAALEEVNAPGTLPGSGTPETAPQDAKSFDLLVDDAVAQFRSGKSENELSEETVREEDTRPVVGLVNQILRQAVRLRASDVHIEPQSGRVDVRFRIDGRLQHVRTLPKLLQPPLVARVKILAALDIVEYRLPQDGRTELYVDGRTVDLRISVLPTCHGQGVVLRILDKGSGTRRLPDVGFSRGNGELFQEMAQSPQGIILVTGPTGSGKSTTLYAALNERNDGTTKILTCEDPIEYQIDGICQSQVNEKVGLTFASQLRAILRQDPDVILVGEIRDQETAQIAIRAALTGHLVLSTLHCNDALSAIPRLEDMGVEPLLLGSTLIGITAQRLVRILCPHCKETYLPEATEHAFLPPSVVGRQDLRLLRAVGCADCSQTGYRGRMAVHEVVPIRGPLQEAIATGKRLSVVRRIARQAGGRSIWEDAMDRVLSGETSLEEIRRVVFFDTEQKTETHASLERAA